MNIYCPSIWAKSVFAMLLVLSYPVYAADGIPPFPEPLTLEYALGLVESDHPDIVEAQSEIDIAKADKQDAASDTGFKTSIRGRVRWIEPPTLATDQGHDDHHLGIYANKRLYDFGRSEARVSAADAAIRSRELELVNTKNRRRINILEAYFNVLVADLEYIRDNEDMATSYVGFDRMQDRNQQGQVSDIEVLRKESEYMKVRKNRYASDVRRRSARSRLALVINRPGMLSSNLSLPALPDNGRKMPDIDELQAKVLEKNVMILALQQKLESANNKLQAARLDRYPILTGELEASDYSRNTGSRDDLRAGITLEVPLTTGGAYQAKIARYRAESNRVNAELARKKMEVQQSVLELWNEIYVLRAQRDEMESLVEYRDLYLDRSRGLYELDVRTDLGDAMVEFSNVRLQSAKTNYELALAWAHLDALTGSPVYDLGRQNK